jgi:hypothetical protein
MNESYNLNSILSAIEDINKIKKKNIIFPKISNFKNIKKNILIDEEILPITEKLILEAEEYSSKIKNKPINKLTTADNILVLDKEYIEQNLEVINLEEIKINIINDLYFTLSKRIKKNTLKIIFDLHSKIRILEKENEILNNVKENLINEEVIDTNEEHLINEEVLDTNGEHLINKKDYETEKEHLIEMDNKDLTQDVIETLQMQSLSITKLKKNEEKLRLKIVDLEQDISLLTNSNK